MKLWLLPSSLFLCARLLAADPQADATARYLAGMSLEGTALERRERDGAWAEHAAEFDKAWAQLEQRQLAKIREWAPQFLGESHEDDVPMFYMFSGPDFLYAHTFFPRARPYILCGIEPVGALPDIEKIPAPALPSALANLRKSLDSVMNWSFFITKNMKTDLNQTQLNGTLPVLYVFLARAGGTIDSVEFVALNGKGDFTAPGRGATPGVKIAFHADPAHPQTLYYFSSDLSDSGIEARPGFMKFCEAQGRGLSLIKAASYLMHTSGFNRVRDFLLGNSQVIVQDDSGIPFRFFRPNEWTIRYFGRYSGPIAVFGQYPQPELAAIYARTVPAPLGFGFGYQWQTALSSLIVARPRAASALPPEEEPEEPGI